jgi:hypothetical protein
LTFFITFFVFRPAAPGWPKKMQKNLKNKLFSLVLASVFV